MIIDTHTHLGRNEHINASVKQLLESMDGAGINKALVFANDMFDCSNEWMLEQIAPHKDRLYGVAAYHFIDRTATIGPYARTMKKCADQLVSWYEEKKIVAVKFYTGYDHYYPIDEKYLLSRLSDAGCPVIFHSGDCLNSVKCARLKYAQPIHIDDVAVSYPDLTIVIAHMGFPWHRDAAEVCYKNANVYADVSGFVYGDFSEHTSNQFNVVLKEFLDIAPHEKLLFGTDFPISNQRSYLDAAGMILSPHGLSENAKKVFKL